MRASKEERRAYILVKKAVAAGKLPCAEAGELCRVRDAGMDSESPGDFGDNRAGQSERSDFLFSVRRVRRASLARLHSDHGGECFTVRARTASI